MFCHCRNSQTFNKLKGVNSFHHLYCENKKEMTRNDEW